MSDYIPVPLTSEQVTERRQEFLRGLYELAWWLTENPDAPLPHGPFTRHMSDPDAFDKAAAVIGEPVTRNVQYEHCEREFGPVRYGVQMWHADRATRDLAERERVIAQRERELGLSSDDLEAAA
jgi:hypothetical protein